MSDNTTEKSDLATQVARAERDLAQNTATTEHVRRTEAENVRDSAISAAATLAAQREVAELTARNEAYIRQEAENAALQARVAANRAGSTAAQVSAENGVLRENLAAERRSASNATFGIAMIAILLLLGLAGAGFWYFNSQNSPNYATTTGPITTASAASSHPSEVSAPAPPSTVHVSPAPIIVVQPAAPNTLPQTGNMSSGGLRSGSAPSGGLVGSEANIPAASTTSSDATSLPTTETGGSTTGTTTSTPDAGTTGSDKTSNP